MRWLSFIVIFHIWKIYSIKTNILIKVPSLLIWELNIFLYDSKSSTFLKSSLKIFTFPILFSFIIFFPFYFLSFIYKAKSYINQEDYYPKRINFYPLRQQFFYFVLIFTIKDWSTLYPKPLIASTTSSGKDEIPS